MTKNEPDLAAKFMKIYANLPIVERTQVVIVINNEPISWELARNEITHDTEMSKIILGQLNKLKII